MHHVKQLDALACWYHVLERFLDRVDGNVLEISVFLNDNDISVSLCVFKQVTVSPPCKGLFAHSEFFYRVNFVAILQTVARRLFTGTLYHFKL